MADMGRTAYESLMDYAQQRLVQGADTELIAMEIEDEYGWDYDTALAIARECAEHPITKILVASATK